MKKAIVAAVLSVFVFASFAVAGDFDFIRGAGQGYLSTYSSPAVFFQAQAGDRLILAVFPVDYTSTVGFCGISRMGVGGTILAYEYSNNFLFYNASVSDLYLFLCVKSSGLSGDIMLAAVDNSLVGMSSSSNLSAASVPTELLDSLQAAMYRQIGR